LYLILRQFKKHNDGRGKQPAGVDITTRSGMGMQMQFPECQALVIHEIASAVLRIELNRPQALNALTTALLGELASVLAVAERRDDVRVVVLHGSRKAFAAGADVQEMASRDVVGMLDDPRQQHWQAISRFSKPLLAAVNGYCLGGGCELAMHADVIIAGRDACFGQPEINLGIMPGAGGTQRLLHAVGKSLAMQMVLSGQPISAERALQAGLVSEITEPEFTLERTLEVARLIAGKAPLALRLAKEALLRAADTDLSTGLRFERHAFTVLAATADRQEGIQAFLDKRPPNFRGC
jgi:enoyl-CoA hydratase